MMGPEDRPAAADRGRIRAAHADREQVIGALKTAFVDGRLTKDELDARAAQAFGARTRGRRRARSDASKLGQPRSGVRERPQRVPATAGRAIPGTSGRPRD